MNIKKSKKNTLSFFDPYAQLLFSFRAHKINRNCSFNSDMPRVDDRKKEYDVLGLETSANEGINSIISWLLMIDLQSTISVNRMVVCSCSYIHRFNNNTVAVLHATLTMSFLQLTHEKGEVCCYTDQNSGLQN